MAFDPDKFREAATKANYTKEEIDSEISRQTQNINTATGKPFGQASEEAVQGKAQELRNQGFPMPGTEAPKEERSLANQLFDWAGSPAGNAVIGGLVGLTAAGIGGSGLKNRMRNQPDAGPKIDPTFDGGGPPPPPPPPPPPKNNASIFTPNDVTDVASRPVGTDRLQLTGPAFDMQSAPTGNSNVMPEGPAAPPANAAPAAVQPLTDKQRKEKALADLAEHRLAEAKKASASKETQQGAPTVKKEKPVSDIDAQLLSYKAKTEQEKSNANAPKPVDKSVPPKSAAAASQLDSSNIFERDANGNIQYDKGMSPSGRAGAEAFAKNYPDLAKQLEAEGKFGILGAGSGDNSLYNSYGAQTRKDIIEQVNKGNLAGPHGGNEGFYNKTLTPAINSVSPDTALGAELSRLRAVQPKGGTNGPLGKDVAIQDGKLVKGKNQLPGALKAGGAAALLMAISDAANAKEVASIIGESLLPIGMTPSELQSGKLTAKQIKAFEEAQNLGSPYRSVPPPKK